MKNLWRRLQARLEFWYARRFIKETKDYLILNKYTDILAFSDDEEHAVLNENAYNILILKEPYDGIIICINEWRFADTDSASLEYSIQVLRNIGKINLKGDEGFRKLVDNIVRAIIAQLLEMEKNENRNTNSGESAT